MNKGARWRGLAATAAMLAVLAIVYAQAAQAAPVDFGAYLRAARASAMAAAPTRSP